MVPSSSPPHSNRVAPRSFPQGFLISFEGLEGSGKSTQIQLLNNALTARGYEVVLSREPGGTALAEAMRGLLLSHKTENLSARTELLLLLAGRSDHIEKVILPALAQGKVVIIDRFMDASIAYQGHGREMGAEYVRNLHQILELWITPRRTFFLRLPVDTSYTRMEERAPGERDRIESESQLFFERVRQGYEESARREPERYHTLEGSLGIEELHTQILSLLERDFDEYCLV